MKHYCRTGRRNHGRPLKRILYTWDRNVSKSGPTPWHIYDDDDDDDDRNILPCTVLWTSNPSKCNDTQCVGFERATLVLTKIQFFWYMKSCRLVHIYLYIRRHLSSSSSSCSWMVRHVSCSLILKMKLVPPSLPRSSYVPPSFWFIL
jgi:hypothetical protein